MILGSSVSRDRYVSMGLCTQRKADLSGFGLQGRKSTAASGDIHSN